MLITPPVARPIPPSSPPREYLEFLHGVLRNLRQDAGTARILVVILTRSYRYRRSETVLPPGTPRKLINPYVPSDVIPGVSSANVSTRRPLMGKLSICSRLTTCDISVFVCIQDWRGRNLYLGSGCSDCKLHIQADILAHMHLNVGSLPRAKPLGFYRHHVTGSRRQCGCRKHTGGGGVMRPPLDSLEGWILPQSHSERNHRTGR